MFKKASLSPILVQQADAYSKPLVTIEAPSHHSHTESRAFWSTKTQISKYACAHK